MGSSKVKINIKIIYINRRLSKEVHRCKLQQLIQKTVIQSKKKKEKKISWKLIKKQKFLIFMSLPFVIWVIVFKYLPLVGWSMAFQDYKPGKSFFDQTWVGFKHFIVLFKEPQFYQALQNTIAMSLLGLVFGTICAIGFALLLNEIKNVKFKKSVQTISYLPHFISWVVAASIITSMLAPSGIVNELLMKFNIISTPIQFMSNPKYVLGNSYNWRYMERNGMECNNIFSSNNSNRSRII